MDYIAVTGSRWHKHGVHVDLVKEGSRSSDNRWDVNFGGLTDLALMAGVDIQYHLTSCSREGHQNLSRRVRHIE